LKKPSIPRISCVILENSSKGSKYCPCPIIYREGVGVVDTNNKQQSKTRIQKMTGFIYSIKIRNPHWWQY